MLAVVVADVAIEGDWRFERRQFGTGPNQLRVLAEWLIEREVEEVVMESTALYWRPVWDTLERSGNRRAARALRRGRRRVRLHLAKAQSNQGPRGRKEGLPRCGAVGEALVAHELTLSFVPDVTQRLWRTVTRRKYQLTCNRPTTNTAPHSET